MTRTIVDEINDLNIENGLELLKGLSDTEVESAFQGYAFDTRDIRAYTFVTELIRREEKWQWQYLASLIMCTGLCQFEGAYFTAYFHALEAIKLAPDEESLREYVLFFHNIPDRVMSKKEAMEQVKVLLSMNPDNVTGLHVLADLQK